MSPPAPTGASGSTTRSTRWLVCAAVGLAAASGLGWSARRDTPADAVGRIEPTLIDLNTADEATLDLLPGIGPALSRRIVEDRAELGPFRTLNDLDRVRGIGPKTIERLRPFVAQPRASESPSDE